MASNSDPKAAIVPLLTRVHDRPHEDAGLDALAAAAGRSPFQFHRWFSQTVGETPKRHVERVRLERAAYLLSATGPSVLSIALEVGFASHETFTRAFRRHFGHTPLAYRRMAFANLLERRQRNRTFRGDGCRLSDVRFEAFPERAMIALRRLGAYADYTPQMHEADWQVLIDWAQSQGVGYSPLRLGYFPDNPYVTPGPLQHAEMCIQVETAMDGNDDIRPIRFQAGTYAIIDHFGPADTVNQAYSNLADGIRNSDRWAFTDAPPVQFFHRFTDPADSHSQVAFRVRRKV